MVIGIRFRVTDMLMLNRFRPVFLALAVLSGIVVKCVNVGVAAKKAKKAEKTDAAENTAE